MKVKKKKLGLIILACAGIFLIILGVVSARSLFTNDSVVLSGKLDEKVPGINDQYQQEVIKAVEESFQNGYVAQEGESKVDAQAFFEFLSKENSGYSNCKGTVDFVNNNGYVKYTVSTNCGKESDALNVSYQVVHLNSSIDNAEVYPVSDGYFLAGMTDIYQGDVAITNNAQLIKFSSNDDVNFQMKIFDGVEGNINTQSNVHIIDVLENGNYYYVLGSAERVVGGDFTELIQEVQNIFAENQVVDSDNTFSFIFQYDKSGNLIAKKLIDPLKGITIASKFLGVNGNSLYISGGTQIIKYNLENGEFSYSTTPYFFFEPAALEDNGIVGYTSKCNFKEIKNKQEINGFVKLNFQGKTIWEKTLKNDEEVNNNSCSDYISGLTSIGDYYFLSYDQSKKIAVYDKDGNKKKNLDYSAFVKKKDEVVTIKGGYMVDSDYYLILNNSSNLIIDRFNKDFQYKSRYSVGLSSAVSSLDFNHYSDINHVLQNKNQFSEFKVLNTTDSSSLIRINYPLD